ncbi:TetR/AcrR family transcriptional regulator [Thaumasiovibrio subtropicus]|uniref:TetR/AcrR family transcriptional regulator n=1 Tax=Thaumasiovibrio subtropicus TaxID=1891207 RepID=UPI000B353982|nr:TetR/AcrR family transcriptional regulator [Thaumasiovibrio subtropicus]
MARTKSFDRADKLREAMELFWRKGYANTSISDLVSHLGINRFSLYNAFVDKDTLYKEALSRYLDEVTLPSLHDGVPSSATLNNVIEHLESFAAIQRTQTMGCFMQNAILERAMEDDGVLSEGNRLYTRMLTAFEQAFENAKQVGELPSDFASNAMSAWVLMQMQGIRVLGKARQYEAMEKGLQVTLQVLRRQRLS